MQEIEPMAGFRTWHVHEGKLLSYGPTLWEPGQDVEAMCFASPHEAPGDRCRCGVNAFYSFERLVSEFEGPFSIARYDPTRQVAGIVSPSSESGSEVVLSRSGFRSRWARVEALIAHRSEVEILGEVVSVRPAQEKLAARYGVPLLEPEEIGAFCLTEGLALREDFAGPSEIGPPGLPPGSYVPGTAFAPLASWSGVKKAMANLSATASDAANASPMQKAIEEKKNRKRYYGPDDPDPTERRPK